MTAPAPNDGPYAIAGLPLAIPADFAGLSFFDVPNYAGGYAASGHTSTQGLPPYKLTYTNDYGAYGPSSPIEWAGIEASQGVYTWTALDGWVAFHAAAGANLLFSNLYTPSFYSATGTAYGKLIEPAGLVGLANLVTAVVARYKAKGTPFKYWQIWQEPDGGYWSGSVGEMVDAAVVTYMAAKAADPTITVFGPSYTIANLGSYPGQAAANLKTMTLTALGTIVVGSAINGQTSGATATVVGVNTGTLQIAYAGITGTFQNGENIRIGATVEGVSSAVNGAPTGAQACDQYAGDWFNFGPPNFGQGNPAATVPITNDVLTCMALVNAAIAGNVKPYNITSHGFDYQGYGTAGSQQPAMQAAGPQWRKQWYCRFMLMAAALGVQRVVWYGHDAWPRYGQYWGGDMSNDPSGLAAGFREIAAALPGKTMTSCSYFHGGRVSATFSDGSAYSI